MITTWKIFIYKKWQLQASVLESVIIHLIKYTVMLQTHSYDFQVKQDGFHNLYPHYVLQLQSIAVTEDKIRKV